MTETDTIEAATELWDFLKVDNFKTEDGKFRHFVSAHGSSYLPTADRAAEVFHSLKQQGLVDLLICTGNKAGATINWPLTEAETFRARILEGSLTGRWDISASEIEIESESKNTGDNVINTKKLLVARGAITEDQDVEGTVVGLQFALRRMLLTANRLWPKLHVTTTCPQVPLIDYIEDHLNGDTGRLVKSLRGEIDRLVEYPKRGFCIPTDIPRSVMSSYQYLASFGAR